MSWAQNQPRNPIANWQVQPNMYNNNLVMHAFTPLSSQMVPTRLIDQSAKFNNPPPVMYQQFLTPQTCQFRHFQALTTIRQPPASQPPLPPSDSEAGAPPPPSTKERWWVNELTKLPPTLKTRLEALTRENWFLQMSANQQIERWQQISNEYAQANKSSSDLLSDSRGGAVANNNSNLIDSNTKFIDDLKNQLNQSNQKVQQMIQQHQKLQAKMDEDEKSFNKWSNENRNHPNKSMFERYNAQWQELKSVELSKIKRVQNEIDNISSNITELQNKLSDCQKDLPLLEPNHPPPKNNSQFQPYNPNYQNEQNNFNNSEYNNNSHLGPRQRAFNGNFNQSNPSMSEEPRMQVRMTPSRFNNPSIMQMPSNRSRPPYNQPMYPSNQRQPPRNEPVSVNPPNFQSNPSNDHRFNFPANRFDGPRPHGNNNLRFPNNRRPLNQTEKSAFDHDKSRFPPSNSRNFAPQHPPNINKGPPPFNQPPNPSFAPNWEQDPDSFGFDDRIRMQREPPIRNAFVGDKAKPSSAGGEGIGAKLLRLSEVNLDKDKMRPEYPRNDPKIGMISPTISEARNYRVKEPELRDAEGDVRSYDKVWGNDRRRLPRNPAFAGRGDVRSPRPFAPRQNRPDFGQQFKAGPLDRGSGPDRDGWNPKVADGIHEDEFYGHRRDRREQMIGLGSDVGAPAADFIAKAKDVSTGDLKKLLSAVNDVINPVEAQRKNQQDNETNERFDDLKVEKDITLEASSSHLDYDRPIDPCDGDAILPTPFFSSPPITEDWNRRPPRRRGRPMIDDFPRRDDHVIALRRKGVTCERHQKEALDKLQLLRHRLHELKQMSTNELFARFGEDPSARRRCTDSLLNKEAAIKHHLNMLRKRQIEIDLQLRECCPDFDKRSGPPRPPGRPWIKPNDPIIYPDSMPNSRFSPGPDCPPPRDHFRNRSMGRKRNSRSPRRRRASPSKSINDRMTSSSRYRSRSPRRSMRSPIRRRRGSPPIKRPLPRHTEDHLDNNQQRRQVLVAKWSAIDGFVTRAVYRTSRGADNQVKERELPYPIPQSTDLLLKSNQPLESVTESAAPEKPAPSLADHSFSFYSNERLPLNKSLNLNANDILEAPGRSTRPPRIALFLRGLPGSGKTHIAKIIRRKENKHKVSPRVLCLDDYFTAEVEKKIFNKSTGQVETKRLTEYEYDKDIEESYRTNLKKMFNKTLEDGYFTFIIMDAVNDKISHFGNAYTTAIEKGFVPFVAELSSSVETCAIRNIHNRTLDEIKKISSNWETTPESMNKLDLRPLLQDSAITEVEMADVSADEEAEVEDNEVKKVKLDETARIASEAMKSKWDSDKSAAGLDKLDGVKKITSKQSMDDFLSVTEDYTSRTSAPGKKRVRWADMQERQNQKRMRDVGFVVGSTDWNRMMDDSQASKALNQTKFI